MFRQPEQRLLSAFAFDGGWVPFGWGWRFPTPPSSVLEYAHFAQGCAVKMLTRTGYATGDLTLPANVDYTRVCQDNSTAVTSDEVALAVSRVGSAFAFVGITDEWSLSMCLLHATFGGDCRSQ